MNIILWICLKKFDMSCIVIKYVNYYNCFDWISYGIYCWMYNWLVSGVFDMFKIINFINFLKFCYKLEFLYNIFF